MMAAAKTVKKVASTKSTAAKTNYTTKQKEAIASAKKEYNKKKAPLYDYKFVIPATIDLRKLRSQTYCELRNPLVNKTKNFWIEEITYSEDLRELTLTDGPQEPEEEYTAEKTTTSGTSSSTSDSGIKKAVAEINKKNRHAWSSCDCICTSNRIFNSLKAKKIGCRIIKYPSKAASNGYHYIVNVRYSSGYKCFDYSGMAKLLKGCRLKGTLVKEYKP